MHPIKRVLKKAAGGASWRNPLLNLGFLMLDPLDWVVRKGAGLGHLPPYSVRVRANGISGQFGGKGFARTGGAVVDLLEAHAGLAEGAAVLEVGCGCGRVPLAISERYKEVRFTGMDIERTMLESCRANPRFAEVGYEFELLDVYSDTYNPTGKLAPEEYEFPFEDAQFDVVYLVSVFTHMLPDAVRNYMKQIRRVLRPGGRCLTTTFLTDQGFLGKGIELVHELEECRVQELRFPEKAVGYDPSFYVEAAASAGFEAPPEFLRGTWRVGEPPPGSIGFAQDAMILRA